MRNKKFDFEIVKTNPVDSLNSQLRQSSGCTCSCANKSSCYKAGYGAGYDSGNNEK